MNGATRKPEVPRSLWRGKMLLAGAWIAITVAGAWGLIRFDIQAAEHAVQRNAEVLRAALADRAMLHEAVIEGLAAALRVCPDVDPSPTREYAQAILARYPQIQMLGAAQAIRHAERADFEAAMRAKGLAPSGIQHFGYDGDRFWRPVPEKELYYPISMVEPESDATRAILGLDLDAVVLFRPALQRALLDDEPVMVGPFDLTMGQRAIGLVRTVCEAGGDSCIGQDAREAPAFVAVLVVFADAIIDCRGLAARGYSCAVWTDDAAPGASTGKLLVERRAANGVSRIERWLLPRMESRVVIASTSQPLVLGLSHQLGRDSVDLALVLTFLLLSGAGLVIVLRAQGKHERSERAKAAAYRALRDERTGLELRVRERTAQLSDINAALERENRAREEAEEALRQKSGQLRLLARRLMDAQEQERRTLARELHDDMGQTLTALRTHAQLIRQQHPSPESPYAQSASTIFDLAGSLHESIHRITRRLRPRALDELGLVGALRASIDAAGLEPMGVAVQTELRGKLDDLDDAVNITVYRLLQEALTNVVRHADARHVRVELARHSAGIPSLGYAGGDTLRLRVEDDGRGMPDRVPEQDRLGLLGAQERVEALGGLFVVERSASGGVLLRAEIPLDRS